MKLYMFCFSVYFVLRNVFFFSDVADKIMLFLLECVRSLKIQMGTAGVEKLVNQLLGLLKRFFFVLFF